MNVADKSLMAALAFLSFILWMERPCPGSGPMDDAVVVWHFDTPNDSRGADSRLTAAGDVVFGIALSPEEAKESKLRGGDGKVARIGKGAYLSAGQGANGELNLTGRAMSIALRLRLSAVESSCPVFSKYGGHELLSYNVFACKDCLGTEVGTTRNKTILSCRAKYDETRNPETAATAWHDVVCRVDGAKLEFFIDGRCVDEDFMVGDLRTNKMDVLIGAQMGEKGSIAAGFEGEFDHIALWNRALSNDEIITLAGGKERADLRERTDRGSGENLQYWCPPNAYGVGDCMPFSHDGVFHFVYLLDKNRHRAKNGLGAHQWIQATSTDLVHWRHLPFVVPITEQNEGSICTGSLFWNDGTYYAFYANRSFEFKRPDGNADGVYGYITCSTSKDGVHFTKRVKPLFYLPKEYSSSTRDPVVYKSGKDGKFHLYATTSFNGRGCWIHAISPDLNSWALLPPILTARGGQPECPDWFAWGDKFYTIAGHGNGFYRVSDSPDGPWYVPARNVIMQGITRVPKTAAFGKDRRIVCGWTGQRGFGGDAVFHELVRYKDGTLGEKFVPEMIPATGKVVVSEKGVRDKEKSWSDMPGNFRLRAVLEFDPANRDALDEWNCILGDKAVRVVAAERAVYLFDAKTDQLDFTKGRIELDLIVKNDLIDLCVDGCRTITLSLPKMDKRSITVRDTSLLFASSFPLDEKSFFGNVAKDAEPGYTLSLEIAPLR